MSKRTKLYALFRYLSLTISIIIITYRYHSGLTGADPVCGGGGRQRGVGRGGGYSWADTGFWKGGVQVTVKY